LTLDPIYNRASIDENVHKNSANSSIELINKDKCITYKIYIQLNLVALSKPIVVKINFDTYEQIPQNDTKFCDTCVVIDPKTPKSHSKEIQFHHGCKDKDCSHDLSINGSINNGQEPFTLGSKKSINVNYTISNIGEAAYLTQLEINIRSKFIQINSIPKSCIIDLKDSNIMMCDINDKKPLEDQQITNLSFSIDVTELVGNSLEIFANVTSYGHERKPHDNHLISKISLTEFSEVEAIG
jgi:hypothetical protein